MAMSRKCLSGKPLTNEDMNTLEELHNYSNYLAENLLKLQNDMSQDGVRIDSLIGKTSEELENINDNMLNTSFLNVEERMQEYPELIYDGPFSEHIRNIKPKLKGSDITKDEAIKIATNFLKDGKKYSASLLSETTNTKFPAYIIELREKDKNPNITMAITKKAGKVIWMLNTKEIGDEKLSVKEGVNKAKDFLRKNGLSNMAATYSEQYDGQLVVNFAYMHDDVIVYTDLIKVKLSLEDGSVIGFEAAGYLSNNHERNIAEPQITEEEARRMISIDAKIEDVKLAIIPTEGSKEVLCYEFIASYKTDKFLIYINALNGEEEDILQVITKENGVLMM